MITNHRLVTTSVEHNPKIQFSVCLFIHTHKYMNCTICIHAPLIVLLLVFSHIVELTLLLLVVSFLVGCVGCVLHLAVIGCVNATGIARVENCHLNILILGFVAFRAPPKNLGSLRGPVGVLQGPFGGERSLMGLL